MVPGLWDEERKDDDGDNKKGFSTTTDDDELRTISKDNDLEGFGVIPDILR